MVRGNNGALLEVDQVTKVFGNAGKPAGDTGNAAVDGVSFNLREGEILGLLGESGCGKTTLARMIMHLERPSSGRITFDGVETQSLSERRFRPLRSSLQMVYQNPFDCLDPSMAIESLLAEPLRIWHPQLDKAARKAAVIEILEECGLGADVLKKKPPEFSGGQLQRISIARALLARPKLLVADEIVSALDVPVQNQILQLLMQMRREHPFSILFITHDLSVARAVSDRIMVMYRGKLVASGDPDDVLDNSNDPYVEALAHAVFTFDGRA